MTTVQLQNISKKYGHNLVLSNVNISVKSGECYAIVGSNGKGKSTLLKIIGGITSPNSGQVTYDGLLLSKNRKKIQKYIGYYPDTPSLFENYSVKENIEIMQKFSDKRSNGETHAIEHWLQNLKNDGVMDTKVQQLSKGMQFKVSFLRCLINKPKVLLLDEPNTNIDNNSLAQLKKDLIHLKKEGTTIILATHQLNFLSGLADRIGFLENEIKAELSGEDFFKLNKRPLLEVNCETASDVCIELLAKKDPNLQINADKTLIRLQLEEHQKNYNKFIKELMESGLSIKQFYEVPITPEQLYKYIVKKD